MARREYDVSIVSSGHSVADARLHRHCAALRRAGLTVEVIARGTAADAPPDTAFRSTADRGVFGRAGAALLLPSRAKGRVLVTLDPDLIPSARAVRSVARGRRLAVDLHEDYVALLADRAWAKGVVGALAGVWARSAVAMSRGADLTVVADDHVPPATAANRLVVRNLPDLSLLPPPAEPGPRPRALYVGDVRASRGLFTMLSAIELAPEWELDVVGPVAPRDQERLAAWRSESPAASRVRLHGRRPPAAAWELATGAWVGFSLLDSTPAFESAIPSKVYEYFACGLPVLTTPIRRAAELVLDADAGAVAVGAEQAAEVLRGWAGDDRDGYERHRRAAVDWASRELGAENPYDRFARAIADLATGTGRGSAQRAPLLAKQR